MGGVQKKQERRSIGQAMLWCVARALNAWVLTLPRFVLKVVPRANGILSVVILYVYAQSLGVMWVFMVSFATVSCTQVVSAALGDESSHGGVGVMAAHPLKTIGLGYAYYCVFRIIMLFSRSMYIVGWEMYGNFPTMRKMLVKRSTERRSLAEPERVVSSGTEMADTAGASELSGHEGTYANGGARVNGRFVRLVSSGDKTSFLSGREGKGTQADVGPNAAAGFARLTSTSGDETGDCMPANAADRVRRLSPPNSPRRFDLPRKSGVSPSTRRQVVLVVPLVFLAFLHSIMFLGQTFCEARDTGACRDTLWGVLDPVTRINRMLRFVLFVSELQWLQAWAGMFPLWDVALFHRAGGTTPPYSGRRLNVEVPPHGCVGHEADSSIAPEDSRAVAANSHDGPAPSRRNSSGGKEAANANVEYANLAHFLNWGLLLGLLPVSVLRTFTWLLRPAGVGTVSFFFGFKHYVVDTAITTAWSIWLLCACFTIMTQSRLHSSGFSIRRVTDDDKWVKLCSTFKCTILASCLAHFVRGCTFFGYARASSDLITITMLYPVVLCLVWIVTFIAMAVAPLLLKQWRTAGTLGALSLAALFGVARILCGWVDRHDAPMLEIFVWLHLCRQLFRALRKWGRNTPLGGVHRGYASPWAKEVKFNMEPRKRKQPMERMFGMVATRTLLLIAISFSSVLGGLVLMAAVQQKQGLASKGSVLWREDAGGLQVVNTKMSSSLTLARPCDTQRATCTANRTQDIQPVLPEEEFPHYAVCGNRWHGLSLVDYAFLSEMAYFDKDSDLQGYLAAVLSGKQVTVQGVFEKPRRWFHVDVRHCSERRPRRGNESHCKVLGVVGISGTDPTRVVDHAENLRMWAEPVALSILSTLFQTVRIWPRDASAMVIAGIHSFLERLGLEDNQWQYQGILEYVRSLPESQDVVITGHSLGGGMALVVGALTNRLAVAIQPPGVYHSLAKHQFRDSATASKGHLHQRSLSLVVEGDWIQHFDGHGGLVQTMNCDASEMAVQLGCHVLEGTICHLLRHCGDDAGRFDGCRHKYTPQDNVAGALQTLLAAVQGGFTSTFSELRPSRDLQAFLITSFAVSALVLTRNVCTSPWFQGTVPASDS